MSEPTAAGNPLDQIIADYLQAAEAGRVPSRQALLDAHPEYADELRAFFADYDRLDNRADALKLATTRPPAQRPKVRYLGDFELLEEIAEGGMGLVYKARQDTLGRIVALKLVRAGRVAKPIDIARFRIEAEAAAGLDHPNIVPLYEVGEHQGQHYLAMKFIDGPSLAKLPRGEVRAEVVMMEKVARAVHRAHQQGILHRDIKPSNILTDASGTPYVTDFGLAKRIDAQLSLTESGQMLGTAGYIAPEQALGKKGLTVTADVFSLGAVLFERLTGTPAFPGGTILERLRWLHEAEPRLPRSFQRGLDRDLETVCLKCLEKEPGKRYSSAEALADDLDRWLRGEPIRARPMRLSERIIRWTRRHRTPVIAIGSAAAAALVAAALVMTFVQNRPLVVHAPPINDGTVVSAPDWLVRAETEDGELTGSCWRTPDPDTIATSMAALGMSSADAPRPTRLEVVWMAARPEERVFPVTIAKLDEPTQTATLRVRAASIPQSHARPVNLDPPTIVRAKESVVFISAARGDEASYGSGFFAQPGLIVTCTDALGMAASMIPPPDKIEITTGAGTPNERVFMGNLVAVDRNEGLAVINVAGEHLPQPLSIAATANMRESERTFYLGYPIGQGWKVPTSLRTTLRIRPSAFSGRIFTQQGSVKYLQFEGGGEAGSGMAVVDTSGEVIGVRLPGSRGSNMRFAVPSEYVTGLLDGRVLELTPGPAVQSAKSIHQPIKLLVADPLQRFAGISLECWTSPRPKAIMERTGPVPSNMRPGMDRQPIPRVGDGPVVTARMSYDSETKATNREGQIAIGELILPPLKANEVYWVRPRYRFKNGREHWGEAVIVEMGRYPIELKPAELAARYAITPGVTRQLELDTRSAVNLYSVFSAGEEPHSGSGTRASLDLRAKLTQEFESIKSDGEGNIRLRYLDLRSSGDDLDGLLNRRIGAPLGETAKRMGVNVVVTKEGKIGSAQADLSEVPAGQRAILEQFNSEIIGALQILSWALPNKVVSPGETWSDEVGLSIHSPNSRREVRLKTTCKYLGRRVRNGQPEAVISMSGTKPPTKDAPYGTIAGEAVIDLASGQTSLAKVEANLANQFRVVAKSGGGEARAIDAFAEVTLRQTLRRVIVPEGANADPPSVLPNQRIILVPLVGVGAPPPLAD
jgi:tRNA A-37 threonylcarbamoyl transferase component Bud32